jgi:hypothetical protein
MAKEKLKKNMPGNVQQEVDHTEKDEYHETKFCVEDPGVLQAGQATNAWHADAEQALKDSVIDEVTNIISTYFSTVPDGGFLMRIGRLGKRTC